MGLIISTLLFITISLSGLNQGIDNICYNFKPGSIWYNTYPEQMHHYKSIAKVIDKREDSDIVSGAYFSYSTDSYYISFEVEFEGKTYKFEHIVPPEVYKK